MSCAPFQELLSASLDNELNSEEEEQLEQHLEQCAACRALQQRLSRLEAGFAHLPEVAAPPLRPRAVSALPAKSPSAALPTALWSLVLAAAACAAITLWNPVAPAGGGSELYFGANQLLRQRPAAQELAVSEFRSQPLHGPCLAQGALNFEIHLDSDSHPCKDLQLEVDYDFDGDGKVDRHEVYAAFDTDAQDGWEVYTHGRGLLSQQGAMKDFSGGTIACRLKNANGEVQLLQGESRLVLPHRLGA